MIAAMQQDCQISGLSEAFGVSGSGDYDHLCKPAGQRHREDEALRPKIAAAAAPNLLLGRPAPTAPDQVWVSDITCIPTGEGWLYLAAVMDLHSRRILGWATASHMRAELAAEALQRARFTRAGSVLTGTIAHSDRGCQYGSGDYRAALGPPQDRGPALRACYSCRSPAPHS